MTRETDMPVDWKQRAEVAESALFKLRERIAGAPVCEPWAYWQDDELPIPFRGLQGKRVRLVVEDGE